MVVHVYHNYGYSRRGEELGISTIHHSNVKLIQICLFTVQSLSRRYGSSRSVNCERYPSSYDGVGESGIDTTVQVNCFS